MGNESPNRLPTFLIILFCVAVLNFAACYLGELRVGGSTLRGKVEGGQYYVGNGLGHYERVSEATFVFMHKWECSTFITHAVALSGAVAYALYGLALHLFRRERQLRRENKHANFGSRD